MATRTIVTIIVVLIFSSTYAQTEVPYEFQSGTPALASEVNTNFETLEVAIDQNASDLLQIQGLAGHSREAAQIQTGLDLTSGLRWLVADAYRGSGSIFPSSNNMAGAGDPLNWSNRFVESANVSIGGVIHIRFRPDASPAIAGQEILLTPIDPGAFVVWFDCSGDSVTDPFLAELDCAFSDAPYEPVNVLRRQVLTAFDLLAQSNAQSVIQDYYNSAGTWPMDNAQAGLADPTQYQNKYVEQLSVSSGAIIIMFGRDSHTSLQGTTITWQPVDHGASIEWTCSSSGILDIVTPAECR